MYQNKNNYFVPHISLKLEHWYDQSTYDRIRYRNQDLSLDNYNSDTLPSPREQFSLLNELDQLVAVSTLYQWLYQCVYIVLKHGLFQIKLT